MLPSKNLVFTCSAGEVVPSWLTEADEPWLRDVLEVLKSCDEVSEREVRRRLREAPQVEVCSRRLNMVIELLSREVRPVKPAVAPRLVRRRAFELAQERRRVGAVPRTAILAQVGEELGVDAERALFATIPGERLVSVPEALPAPSELRLRVNLALAQGLVRRATRVELELGRGARDLVRAAQLRRLLCVVRRRPGEGAVLEISGVGALFRRTTLYGRALASLVPRLAWSGDYRLRAWCLIHEEEKLLRLGPSDPIRPSKPPRLYDSKLEARFAREFNAQYPDWRLTREPEAVAVGEHVVFPDFGLEHGGRRWLVELVGFWTPEYLARKIESLSGTGVLLCIDQDLGCGDEAVEGLPVVWFRRRLDPTKVVDALTEVASCGGALRATERLHPHELFLDYAGRLPPSDGVHSRLAGLKVGDELFAATLGSQLALATGEGVVAVLSRRASRRWAARWARVERARVVGLTSRSHTDSAPGFRRQLAVSQWWVPAVELEWFGGPASPG